MRSRKLYRPTFSTFSSLDSPSWSTTSPHAMGAVGVWGAPVWGTAPGCLCLVVPLAEATTPRAEIGSSGRSLTLAGPRMTRLTRPATDQ